MENQSGTISIPMRNGEVVDLALDSLPPVDECLNILRSERAELHHWIKVGLAYYRQGRFEEFHNILELSGNEAGVDYPGIQEDQMKALDILAGYYVTIGHKERSSKEQKKYLFSKATLLYTAADKLKMYDNNHLAGRAYFCLVEGRGAKLDQASQQFNFVLKQDPNAISAMMGMACIHYNKKDYKNALYYYKKCLRQKPDGPADFRIGIGMCLAKMNQIDKARFAFERALEIEPLNVTALTALAILDSNDHTEEALKASIQKLGRAYKIESDNPVVLVNLANHFFFRLELDRVAQLAQHALNIAESDTIKAEACFQLARCYHKEMDYEKAFKYYYQATTLNQNLVVAFYGLAQLHIQRGEYPQAIAALEFILKSYPNCTDTLKMLGSLYAHSEPENATYKQKAREVLSKYLQTFPNDTEVMIDLAQLLEYSDPAKSLALYEKSCELLREGGDEPPAELINNIGSLYSNQGKYEKARQMFIEAERKLRHDIASGDSDDTDMSITIQYNLARCLEHLCLYDDAEGLYKDILKKQANYTDCMIRLGCIARDRGQIYDASMLFKEAISVNQSNADPWTFIGLLHMSKHEWGPAQKKFEHILKMKENSNRTDAYSHIALGNVWLESLFNPLRDRNNDQKFYDRALQMFTKGLKIQPKNMWAANGIGCILAHKKMWMEARDLFTQVREATADFYDVWLNIAHIYMEMKQFVPAIQMYTNAMRKFGKENDTNLLMSLARAFYYSQKLQECRETLEKAMLEAPDNVLTKINYAVVLKKMAKRVLQDVKATTVMVTGAMDDLTTAERIFTYIAMNKDDTLASVRLVSRTTSGNEGRECKDMLKQAQSYLTRAQQQDEEESRMRRKQEEDRMALLDRMEKEKMAEEEEKRRKEEEQRALRQSYVEMTKDYLRMPEIKEEEKKSRGGGGRKKKGGDGEEFVNDSSDMGDWQREGGEGDGERRERKKKDKAAKKASRKKREKKEFGGSGSEDEDDKAERKRKKADAAARKAEAKLSAKQSAKIKSRAFLSSDDDSSDGAPPPQPNLEEDSPPPAMPSSDSDDSEPKPRKKKPMLDSDASGSDDDRSAAGSPPPPSGGGSGGSDSEEESPRKKKAKKVASSSENSDSD